MAKTWVNFKEVRQKLDFDLVLSHFDLPAGKGNDFKIPCPFHDDKKPSCSVNRKKNVFHCFSCGAKGNTLDFVTLMNGGDIGNTGDVREGALLALEILGDSPNGLAKKSKKLGAEKKKRKSRPKKSKKKKGSEKSSESDKGRFGNKTSYTKEEKDEPVELIPLTFALKVNPSHAFLRERGITTEIAERHGIGYCNRGMMKGRICFPLKNATGELVGYSGRYVDTGGDILEDMARYKLPKGFPKQSVLFNYDRLLAQVNNGLRQSHAVIVEGFWSAIKFDEAGIPAVACMGSSLSEPQITLLIEAGIKSATVIFDGDEAGRAGQAQALFDLSKRGLSLTAYHMADGLSPDALSEDQIRGILPGLEEPENAPLKEAC